MRGNLPMNRFCRLALCHTGPTANVFLGLHQAFQLVLSLHRRIIPSNLTLAHPDSSSHASWHTSTEPPGFSSFAAYPPTFASEVGTDCTLGTCAFGGRCSNVWMKLQLFNAHVYCLSVLSLSLTVCSCSSETDFNYISWLMMESNAALGITVTLQELLMLLCVCLYWSLVVSDARSVDIVILIS